MKRKYNILIADRIDLAGIRTLDLRKFNLIYEPGISNEDILSKFIFCDAIIIRSIRKIPKKFLQSFSGSLIATCSKGTDHIDTAYAKKKNIHIINSISGNADSAAEHTIGLIIACLKNMRFSDKLVRCGKFGFYDFPRRELKGKTIGIIGFGNVGSRVSKLAKAFGMNILANDTDKGVINKNPGIKFTRLEYLLKNSDIITIHIPLNRVNRGFISVKRLSLFKRGCVFINTSRGEVVNEKELIKCLKNGKISFAGLDVFSEEPSINPDYAALENTIYTNHIAGKTPEAGENISKEIYIQVKNYFLTKRLRI